MHKRGEINNPDRAKQLRDYSGIRYGNITPTDIDGLIEYKNTAYILIELKYLDAIISRGQGLALERLTDDLERNGKPTLCLFSSHDQHNPEDDINVATTKVIQFRLKRQWRKLENQITTKELIDLFLKNISIDPETLENRINQDCATDKPREITYLSETDSPLIKHDIPKQCYSDILLSQWMVRLPLLDKRGDPN